MLAVKHSNVDPPRCFAQYIAASACAYSGSMVVPSAG